MLLVGEDLVLQWQEGAAGVDQVDARQVVLARDFLRAQVLLDRHWEVGAALDRSVVGHDYHLLAHHPADAADHACRRRGFGVHPFGGQRRDLEERRAGVEQGGDAVARQQLAARSVFVAGLVAAAGRRACKPGIELIDQCAMPGGVVAEILRAGVEGGAQYGHAVLRGDGDGTG